MHFKKILIMVAAMAMLFGMSVAVAQDADENEGIAQVVIITAKDGHADALEEAIVKYHHYMGKKEGALRYAWFSIIAGPDTGKYAVRTGNHNWADFDAEHDWQKEAGEKFASEVQPHIASSVIRYTEKNSDVGIWPESMEGYKYFSVSYWHIAPGHGRAFNEGLKKIDTALKANGFPGHYEFHGTALGGHGNETTVVNPYKSFADMADKEPSFMEVMTKAMGEDDANALMADWSKTYTPGDRNLLVYMAEQSDYGDSK